jgi:(p)ppGpp synthase/HD superfamily hydrolase
MPYMIYTQKIQHAIRFAIKTHEIYQKQKRKGKDVPYITHPLAVGLVLARANAPEDVIIAGILHDTIEDSIGEKKPLMPERIKERFGEKVLGLVMSVTEQNKDLSWEERKIEALEHIKTFSNDMVFLKSADVISNASETITDYEKGGEDIFTKFHAPKEKIIENYLRVINALLDKWPENPLKEDLQTIAQKFQSITLR